MATCPAMPGETSGITDATGQYQISDLPASNFTLLVQAQNYVPWERRDIILKSGTERVNVELRPENPGTT